MSFLEYLVHNSTNGCAAWTIRNALKQQRASSIISFSTVAIHIQEQLNVLGRLKVQSLPQILAARIVLERKLLQCNSWFPSSYVLLWAPAKSRGRQSCVFAVQVLWCKRHLLQSRRGKLVVRAFLSQRYQQAWKVGLLIWISVKAQMDPLKICASRYLRWTSWDHHLLRREERCQWTILVRLLREKY